MLVTVCGQITITMTTLSGMDVFSGMGYFSVQYYTFSVLLKLKRVSSN